MDRKAVIVLSLCVAFLIYWYQQYPASTSLPNQEGGSVPTQSTVAEGKEIVSEDKKVLSIDNSKSNGTDLIPKLSLFFDSPNYRLSLNPYLGVESISLKNYNSNIDPDSADVSLGDKKYPSFSLDISKLGTSDYRYSSEKQGQELKTVESSFLIDKSVLVTQEWTRTLDSEYSFRYQINFQNISDKVINLQDLRVNVSHLSSGKQEQGFVGGQISGIDQVVSFFSDDSLENFSFYSYKSDLIDEGKIEQIINKLEYPQGFDWLAVSNGYFTAVLDPNEKNVFNKISLSFKGKDKQRVSSQLILNSLNLSQKEKQTFNFDCYFGPKKLSVLEKLPYEKSRLIQLGNLFFSNMAWLDFIATGVLKSLIFFESLISKVPFFSSIGSYGLAIILLTVIIKLLFWPITKKANYSMKKMKDLAPKLKKLKEKYKNNSQEYARQQMALFKEEKINPLGGCLPILLQIPIFIALFNALRGSIELRHSHFLWAEDLSVPDTVGHIFGLPINIFALSWIILMVAQQVIMQKDNVSLEKIQKRMMLGMMLFIGLLAYSVPSGLTIYWTFQTFISIIQYRQTNKINLKKG